MNWFFHFFNDTLVLKRLKDEQNSKMKKNDAIFLHKVYVFAFEFDSFELMTVYICYQSNVVIYNGFKVHCFFNAKR